MGLKIRFIFCIVLIIFTGCVKQNTNYCTSTKDLETEKDKIDYLIAIWDSDQGIRIAQKEISQDSMNSVDEENLCKIRSYINQYGYPEASWDYKANLAPWVVVHHSGSVKNRRENFRWLHKAYQAGNLKEEYFLTYLDRLFTLDKGERLDMGTTYRNEDRVKKLIKELNLE